MKTSGLGGVSVIFPGVTIAARIVVGAGSAEWSTGFNGCSSEWAEQPVHHDDLPPTGSKVKVRFAIPT